MTEIDAIWLFSLLMESLLTTLWLPLSPSSTPIGVLVVLAIPAKNSLKWQTIQLTVHSTVDAYNIQE